MNESVVDLKEVMDRVQDDKELLLELFEIFTNDYLKKIELLKTAVGQKNIEGIKDIVHSIKGAAGNISAKTLHATCVYIEGLCANKDISAIESALPTLEKDFKKLQTCMTDIKNEFNK